VAMENHKTEQVGTALNTEAPIQGTSLEPRVLPPQLQPVLVATAVGAIIVAIAIGSFWTSF